VASDNSFTHAPPKGSLAYVRLKDFMTYKDSQFTFGQGFNVVIGPNGSGKSSIVSAIGKRNFSLPL
jgi:recombinational DNA repair ATPase RecF